MNFAEYIKALKALKKLFEGRIIAAIPDIEQLAYLALLDWMDTSLDVKAGNLVISESVAEAINDFSNAYLRLLSSMKPYRESVSQFVKELPQISKVMRKYQEAANGISWAAAHVEPVQKIVVNEIIDAYTENGLNAGFVQPVRDMIYQNVVAGTSFKEAKETLKDYIVSGEDKTGKLGRYLTQTAQQATDSYSGAINKKLMSAFDYEYLQMSGSLIQTSSPQCRKGINGYEGLIDRDIWENELKPLAKKNGLIEGTTFENLPFNRLHWGCRHEFTPTMVKMGNPEVIKKTEKLRSVTLYADLLLVGPLKEMYEITKSKVAPVIRKAAFNKYLNQKTHSVIFENKKYGTKLFDLEGSDYDNDELNSFKKLVNAGKHVIIPNRGAFKKGGAKNDLFLIDPKTFYNEAAELKIIKRTGARDTFEKQIGKAGKQASTVVMDIWHPMSSKNLIGNLRASWNDDVKKMLIYYRRQFREISRNDLFDDKLIQDILK